ncbi:hypothetical protein DSM106972_007080 [Dulcicalothrix desertica PCC 7102]|uniref:Uncharacterized protein n=1 Tax=Dulcicalothrix desertica PCC 7102 TaxID=232991 RepID=A0A433VVU5_9CYAN|nr:T3SS effector HopA1 family protein [Dulcicalothrix desertica]RUT10213.1 hypothetical protein DSM106972_007080 [Dulcicalothrix desertica PCC 7102]TWH40809.1 hypothetical protein CAL7102_10167 [Dulcicalothrix desertica PCC 7102]
MQLLDFPQSQPQTSVLNRVLESFKDIASNVKINSNFCISHPAYEPFELPAEVVTRFQRIPLELQNKYLSLQLQSFIYGIYYNGSMQVGGSATNLAFGQNQENNTFLGINLEFYKRLHTSNSGEGYFEPGWLVLCQESDGSLAVKRGGLTLHIDRQQHLQLSEQCANIGDLVSIRMPRNLVQNGFYVAVSNAGANTYPQTVRIYFNLSPEGAVIVMESLTRQLNETKIPFTFKVLYDPSDYKRYDSGVLYFERGDYKTVLQVLKNIYIENQFHFRKDIPLFTKLLAPGLSIAEEPNSKFADSESFGTNRCQIIANALLEARQQGNESIDYRMNCIHKHFFLLGIDLQRPYLNANSQDIYTTFDLS